MKIGLIGIGNMNGSILDGLIKVNKHELYIYNRTKEKIGQYTVNKCDTIEEIIQKVDIIILGYKPNGYIEFLNKYAELIGEKLFISIAAGMSSEAIGRYLKNFVITMPNTPVLVNSGTIAIVDSKNNQIVEEIFAPLGKTFIIEETQMHDFIAIAGSAPAYFFYLIDCIVNSQDTIDYTKALEIVTTTMLGSAKMAQNFDNMEQLVKNVCSPNGTTIEAINTFDENKLDIIVNKAIYKCSKRSRDITNEIKVNI